ncbi:fluoride efflux transporter FluC [[Kitasatospora] papulosa]|uniref:fluoride efflux transporter FluC n=1 Tax=[Kitasatospora] papulosa TaxID=1464011 RepID=UPI0036822AE0
MDPACSKPNRAERSRRAGRAGPDTVAGLWPSRNASSSRRREAQILAVVSVGGGIGACARYGTSLIWPTVPGAFPWTTFWINVTGSAVLGILVVLTTEKAGTHPLVRPFLFHGVLSGYTAFSVYAADAHNLIRDDRVATALLYLAVTLAAALFAIWASTALTRLLMAPRAERDEDIA